MSKFGVFLLISAATAISFEKNPPLFLYSNPLPIQILVRLPSSSFCNLLARASRTKHGRLSRQRLVEIDISGYRV
ncbi:hypothetical protein BDZ97DRAFT_1824165 [Flammula alnicola]|nr:hypothetical protein BDZ97DRAFT_1824165 [Flammula alnicola]